VRIFCELAFREMGAPTSTKKAPSPAGIARKLGLDEKTVRLRVKKMEEAGFIKYYQLTPELALFGLKSLALYRFEAMNVPTKDEVVQHLRGQPGVLQAFDHLGPTVSVSFAGPSPATVRQLAGEIAGRFELKMIGLGEIVIGEPKRKLDRIDWKIVQRLRYDARSSHKEVAKALSITPRMAEYRTEKLLASGAVLVRAVINPKRQEGLVFYELGVTVEPAKRGSVINEARKLYGEKLWSVQEPAPGMIMLNMFGFTLAEPEDVAIQLSELSGVRWCSILILKEVLEPSRPNWIDALIQARVSSG